jgi:UDP-N-acetylmuramate--alanine ligase
MENSLKNFNKILVLGIGGAGMSGIANILLQQGIKIVGADKTLTNTTEFFTNLGILVYKDTELEALEGCDLIIASSAISESHPFYIYAQSNNIPLWTRHKVLPELLKEKKVIAISGSHGKTTTTSMVAHLFKELGVDVGFLIGTPKPKEGGYWGSSEWFVIEADEYAKTFLCLKPTIAVVNNVDWDHPDIYPTELEYIDTFKDFISNTFSMGGKVLLNTNGCLCMLDTINNYQKIEKESFKTFSLSTSSTSDNNNDYIIKNIDYKNNGTRFILSSKTTFDTVITNKLGEHNVFNATSAIIATSMALKKTISDLSSLLANFGTVSRRCEKIGKTPKGAMVIDDYAHCANEIKTTLEGIKKAYPDKQVIGIWQPHGFNRIQEYEKDFIEVCKTENNDQMFICPIYGARDSGNFDFTKFEDVGCKVIPSLGDVWGLITDFDEKTIIVLLNAGDLSLTIREKLK